MSTCTYSHEVLAKVAAMKKAEIQENMASGYVPTPGQKIVADAAAYVVAQMQPGNGSVLPRGRALMLLVDAYKAMMPKKPRKAKPKICWRNPNPILRHTVEPHLLLIQGGKP